MTKPRTSPGLCVGVNSVGLGFGCCGSGFAGLGGCAGLGDVDAALEEGAVFDGDSGCDYVTGQRAFAADVYAVRGLDVAANLAEHHDFAGGDVGGYLAVAADGDAIAGQVDGALYLTVDVEGLGAGELALDYEAFADGRLVAAGDACDAG